MSFDKSRRHPLEAIIILSLSVAAMIWYAHPQIASTFYFFYQLGFFLFPELMPDIRSPF